MRTTNELMKEIPSKIKNEHGTLTIVKRKNEAYYCYYPGLTKIPVIKAKSLDSAVAKMYNELVDRKIIIPQIEKKKKIVSNDLTVKETKKRPFKNRMKTKLRIQKRNLDKK